MNKINDIGMQLLEYKNEYSKNHPSIVIDSLSLSLDQLVTSKIVERRAVDLVKNKDFNVKDFKEFLLSNPKYSKTEKQIEEEMEVVREEFSEVLEEENLNFTAKTIVENETFFILKTFNIDTEFVLKFFGVDRSELSKLMERKGFVEKFSALRLTQVLREISSIINSEDEEVVLQSSLVYFNSEESGFDIDLIYEVQINEILDNEEGVIEKLKLINDLSESLFKKKMQFHGMSDVDIL